MFLVFVFLLRLEKKGAFLKHIFFEVCMYIFVHLCLYLLYIYIYARLVFMRLQGN